MKAIRRAKVIVQAPTIDTYANVFAAIALRNDIDEIVLAFSSGKADSAFVENIIDRLREHGQPKAYALATRLKVSEEPWSESEIDRIMRDCDLVDVTAVSKRLAIALATKALTHPTIKVCDLSWVDQFEKGVVFRVGDEKHRFSYADLLGDGATKAVRRDYFAKKHVLAAFSLVLGGAFLATIAEVAFGFAIPDSVTNVLGLLIGLGGLYLAYISLQKR